MAPEYRSEGMRYVREAIAAGTVDEAIAKAKAEKTAAEIRDYETITAALAALR